MTASILPTAAAAASGEVVTAEFSNVPDAHDGSTFEFELLFAPVPSVSYRTLRDETLSAADASVQGARRKTSGSNEAWIVTVAPDSDHLGDIVVSLAATVSCTDDNAVCTSDGASKLAEGVTVTVPGPDSPSSQPVVLEQVVVPEPQEEEEEQDDVSGAAVTAEFSNVPDAHDGSAFEFELLFAPVPSVSYRTLRDETLSAAGATVQGARRKTSGSNEAWIVTVAPDSGHLGDIVVSLAATVSCDDDNAVCTSEGAKLAEGVSVTVPGPDSPQEEPAVLEQVVVEEVVVQPPPDDDEEDEPLVPSFRLGPHEQIGEDPVVILDGDDDVTSDITDDQLLGAVRAALGRTSDNDEPITAAQMAALTTLSAVRLGIVDLTGIEHATGLTTLDLRFNDLTSIDLSANTALTTLKLDSSYGLTSIDLSANIALTDLQIWGGNISTITGLSELTALTRLYLRDNPISSIDVSANTALTHLAIGQQWWHNGSAGAFPKLTSIDLSANTALTHLNLRHNALTSIADITGFNTLTNLQVLNLSANFLRGAPDTVHPLNTVGAGILDLTAHTALTELYVYDNRYLGVYFTADHTSLKKLGVGGPDFRSVTGISHLTNLEQLTFATANTTSIPLTALTKLKTLVIKETNVTEINLSGLTKLEFAFLANNKLSSLSVAGLTKLMYLNVHGNNPNPQHRSPNYLYLSEITNRDDLPTGAHIRAQGSRFTC